MLAILGRRAEPVSLQKLLFFELEKLGDLACSLFRSWKSRLAELLSPVEFEEPTNIDWAKRAVWLGEPFVLVGSAASLNQYLDGMDEDTNSVFADCAYFWLLTESSSYSHRRLPNDRVVVLCWSAAEQNVI